MYIYIVCEAVVQFHVGEVVTSLQKVQIKY